MGCPVEKMWDIVEFEEYLFGLRGAGRFSR